MRFRVIVYVAFVLIVGLFAWQLYGAHHSPHMNALPGVQQVLVVHSLGQVEVRRWG